MAQEFWFESIGTPGPARNELPGFVVHIGDDNVLTGLPALPVYSVLPSVRLYGTWTTNEICHVSRGRTHLLVFGHCLLERAELTTLFAAAVESGKLGEVTSWPGSYAAIVARDGTVSAYADLAGQFPIYYGQRDKQLLIGSDPSVLANSLRRTPDPLTAGARIACPDVLPLWSDRSPFQGVSRLAGGAVIQVNLNTRHVSISQPPVPRTAAKFAATAGEFRTALTEGVRLRCAGRQVSSDFSGGLDSTSVAFLAASHSQSSLPALTYHQPLAPSGDLEEAIRCSRLDRRIDLRVVRGAAGSLPYAMLGRAFELGEPVSSFMPYLAEPSPIALSWPSSTLRLTRALSADSELHLTGEGADALVQPPPSYLATLVRSGRFYTLLRHCGVYARLRHEAPGALVRQAMRLARTDLKTGLATVAAELERPNSRPSAWSDAIAWWPRCGEAAGWLTPGLRRQLAAQASDSQTAAAVPGELGPADLAALTSLRHSADAQCHLRDLGGRIGLAVHAPFLDTAVIRAVRQLPVADRADPHSYKPLLSAALSDLVPGEVLSRRTKGDYQAEDYRGARQAAPALHELLRDSRLADLGVIEPGMAKAALERMSAGAPVPLGSLNMLFATEVWLRAADHTGGS
jgi:asparagine synthase (glutamine-hydrolysing)